MMNKSKRRGYSLMKDSQLKAVHDDDLVTLLKTLGSYDGVSSGQCHCYFCKNTITLDNIGSIFPLNGEVQFSCDSPVCLTELVRGEAGGNDI